jgi:hypothetical protein
MAKGYWVATYRSISDPNALAAYAKLGGRRFRRRAAGFWCAASP